MDTGKLAQERISSLLDGEASDIELRMAFAALDAEGGKDTWDIYHQIGDALRSDEMAFAMPPHFPASLRARLDAEPTVVCPPLPSRKTGTDHRQERPNFWSDQLRRFAAPGVAVVVVVTTFLLTSAPRQTATVADNSQPDKQLVVLASDSASASATAQTPNAEILRDPQIDQYLLAHQRFAPSAYSIAQYARPAIFTSESDK